MIRNREAWENWENRFKKSTPPHFPSNLRLLDAMYDEARALGAFPPGDPWQGFSEKLKWIRALHVSKTS